MPALAHVRTRLPRALAALLLCAPLLGVLLLPAAARAERVGGITLPEGFPDLLGSGPAPVEELVAPPAADGVWSSAGGSPLGVNLDNYQLTVQQIDAASGTGCRLVRLPIPMEAFLDPDDADWAALDQVVSRLSRGGFTILPVLDAASVVPDFYLNFCTQIATRYGKTFSYYQILDNINYKHGLTTRDYADIVTRARLAIVLADSDAKIVSGGIRGADLTFLDMLELQRALRSIDVLAFNLYPSKDGIETPGNLRREHSLPYMTAALDWADARGKPVWVTSFGVSCDLSWVGVDLPTQAALYTRGALYLGWIGVEHVFFAAIQDSDPDYQSPARCCGLLDTYGEPKPAYHALKRLNETLQGAYHVNPVFSYEAVTYQQPNTSDFSEYATKAFEAREAFGGRPDPAQVLEYGDQVVELSDILNHGPVGQMRVRGLPVYAFWFYSPETQEYRLIYWLAREQNFQALVTIVCGHPRLTPFGQFITPARGFGLLDDYDQQISARFANNMFYVPFLQMDTMPAVLCFKLNGERVQNYLASEGKGPVTIQADPPGLRPGNGRGRSGGPRREPTLRGGSGGK